jgi:hypothetical protein
LRLLSKWSVRGEHSMFGPSLRGDEEEMSIGLPTHLKRSGPGGGEGVEPKALLPSGVQDLLQRLRGARSNTGGRMTGAGSRRSPGEEAVLATAKVAAAGLLERWREVSPRRR